MAKIVVFGSGGYLGIPLCQELERHGHSVMAVDRYFFGKKPVGPSIVSMSLDIRDFDQRLLEGQDAVIDLAGLSNDATAEIDPALTLSINIDGAIRLANLAKAAGVKTYVYSSSASVYGHGDKLGLSETDKLNPLTDYAKSKVAVETHLRAITDDTFRPTILRNATVFGVAPRMRFDLAINIMTYRAWKEGTIYVMGGGDQWRPFVHVSDVVAAFLWAMEDEGAKGETFNVGFNDLNLSIKQVASMVRGEFPKARIHRIPDDTDKRSYHLSFGKFNRAAKPASHRSILGGIREISAALMDGSINGDDPTGYTLNYYKSILEWDSRLAELRIDGRRVL